MFTYQPRTAIENELVQKICDAEWKAGLASVQYINLVTIATREHMDEFADMAGNPAIQHCYAQNAGLRANAKLLEQLSRHEARFNRIVEKCTWELKDAIEERQEMERNVFEAQKAAAAQQAAAQQAAETEKAAKQTPAPHTQDFAKQTQPPAPANTPQPNGNPGFQSQAVNKPRP